MKKARVYASEGSIWKSILLTVPMILIILVFISGGTPDLSTPEKSVSFLLTFLFLTTLFFLILFTGRTDRYRTGFRESRELSTLDVGRQSAHSAEACELR